jgi:hypothetical protein
MNTDLYRTFIEQTVDDQHIVQLQADHTSRDAAEQFMIDELSHWPFTTTHFTAISYKLDWDPANEALHAVEHSNRIHNPNQTIEWRPAP